MKSRFINSEVKNLSVKKSIVIAGLARNCEQTIQKEVATLNKAFSVFQTIKWIIVESDSSDNTVNRVIELQEKYDIVLISLGDLENSYPSRTHRIAYCRNQYLDYIEKHNILDTCDYLVVADLDGVNKKITKNAIQSCMKGAVKWDACFANQLGAYYDIWALRHKYWSPSDCFKVKRFLLEMGLSRFNALNIAIFSKMLVIDKRSEPIPVISAFGGLGIYKMNIIKGARYIGLDQNGVEICEHVSFNKAVSKRGGKLYIFPSLINGSWNRHSIPSHKFVRPFLHVFLVLYKSKVMRKILDKFKQ